MMTIIPVVVEQHAEEAAFLWLLRDSAIVEPHYSLPDLAHLDDRVEANIDGLRIAQDEGWDICKETYTWEDEGEIFATAVLSFESSKEDHIQTVLDAGSGDPELSRGIISALGWLSYPQAEIYIQEYLGSETKALCHIGIAASAIHRKDPGNTLHTGLNSSDALLNARALKAIGELGKTEFAAAVIDHLNDEDVNSRYYAAWSSSLLGNMTCLPVLRAIAETGGPYAERAWSVAMRRMGIAEAHDWNKAIAEKPELQRIALIGAGAIGDPALIPWLIDYLSIPEWARLAGESLSMITGVDLVDENLDGKWPEGFEAGPTEEPEDEDVAMDPDEDLPWPEPKLIHEWWGKNKSNFRNGTRYLCGKPISEQQCQHVLRYGYQRQRAAAAIELVMMKPGQPLFEVRAPGFRQQKLLGLKK